MNWEANLAAIIKHTDANLEQQFRHFADVTADLGAASHAPYGPHHHLGSSPTNPPVTASDFGGGGGGDGNFASRFLREALGTTGKSHHHQYAGNVTFAEHFRARQGRHQRRSAAARTTSSLRPENNGDDRSDDNDDEGDDDDDERGTAVHPQQDNGRVWGRRDPSRRRHRSAAASGLGAQMYSSPTYDMAQLMEQVRLSLKLEVDARAAIAERQLSALLQLSKATSEELDRLRVEVCASDRQLHTLEQVQAKLRQELTTQKDIGFHLQSMCGKDESWRIQAENQLLELRQMVGAVREQGNSIQVQVQEKLSRQELLVQFNAAIEPIKAQFQATLQHQAQQLAEITRSSSSSTLLLDALTQKVNRAQADEICDLRNEVQAMKAHISRISILRGEDDNERDEKRKPPASPRVDVENIIDQVKRNLDTRIVGIVTPIIKSETEQVVVARLQGVKEEVTRDTIAKHELVALQSEIQQKHHDAQRQSLSISTSFDQQQRQLEHSIRVELSTVTQGIKDRQDQLITQLTAQLSSALETRVTTLHTRAQEVAKLVETEQRERKQAVDAIHDDVRKSRHNIEEQLHQLTIDSRNKLSAHAEDWMAKIREIEKTLQGAIDRVSREGGLRMDQSILKLHAELDGKLDKYIGRLKELEDQQVRLGTSTQQALESVKQKPAADEDTAPRRGSLCASETQSQLASIDSLLQRMMLQMQLQQQHHSHQQHHQAQMALQTAASIGNMWPALQAHAGLLSPPPTPTATIGSAAGSAATIPAPYQAPVIEQPAPSPAPTSNASAVIESSKRNRPSNVTESAKPEKSEVRDPLPTASICAESIDGPKQSEPPVRVSTKTVDETAGDPIDDIISRVVSDELRHNPIVNTLQISESQNSPRQVTSRTPSGSSTPSTAPTNATIKESASPPSVCTTAPEIEGTSSDTGTVTPSTKGAMAEAEMAKQRVEARRKQELEARQQQQQSNSTLASSLPALSRSASTSVLSGSAERKPDPTPLVRSNSVSQISGAPIPTANLAAGVPTSGASIDPPRPPPIRIHGTGASASTPPPPPLPGQPKPPASVAASPLIPRPSGTIPELSNTVVPAEKPVTPVPRPSPTEPPVVTPAPSRPPPSPPTAPTAGGASVIAPITSPTSSPPPPSLTPPPVICEQCRLPVRADLLVDHMQRQCIKRVLPCSKCQLKFPWHEVETHERTCAGPTKPSTTSPVASTTAALVPDSTGESAQMIKKCRHCSADVPGPELFEHELRCDQMLKQCPHCLRRHKVAELQDHIDNCDCRLVSCPNDCGGKFLQRGIPKHLATRCPKRPITGGGGSQAPSATMAIISHASPSSGASSAALSDKPGMENPVPPAMTATESSPGPNQKVECKFCDEEFPAREIDVHENNCDWKPKRCQHCNMVIISRDLHRHEAACKTSTKNCPHCNETMPQASLTTHTSRCSKRPIKCIRCCQLFPADSIVAHSSNCKFVPSTTSSPAAPPTTPNIPPAPATTSMAATPMKIPPPPPYPPSNSLGASSPASNVPAPSANKPSQPTPSNSRPSSGSIAQGNTSTVRSQAAIEDMNVAERLARRNMALSQLTNPAAASSAAVPAASVTGRNQPKPEDEDYDIDGDDGEGDEDEEESDEEDDDDDDQLTLAQVVAEWSVENVCLWLHEDVGVPEVVPRFQQRRCNGEMLLDLTESDLINDFGIKNRIHRERILSAIDAIKTSDDFSDDDDGDENDESDVEEGDDDHIATRTATSNRSNSLEIGPSRQQTGPASQTREVQRRNSLPSPQSSPARLIGTPTLPSSSAMLRRINSALNVEFPAKK